MHVGKKPSIYYYYFASIQVTLYEKDILFNIV